MWTVQDAKNRFSAVVEAPLSGIPQQVTRRGKPAVVVLSADDYAHLLERAVAARVRAALEEDLRQALANRQFEIL